VAPVPRDHCPNGDFSGDYYDGTCGTAPEEDDHQEPEREEKTEEPHGAADPEKGEYETAYERAYRLGITTMPTVMAARIYDPINRAEMAKMISVYAKKFTDLQEDTTKQACSQFRDMNQTNKELQGYIVSACQLGLMGYRSDGVRIKPTFSPNDPVTRAEF